MKQIAALLIVVSAAVTNVANAVMLSLVPAATTIDLGDALDVDLVVSDLGAFAPDSLGAFATEITFDETLLTFDSVAFGPLLGVPDADQGIGIDPPFESDIFVSRALPGVVMLDQVSFLFDFELDVLQPASFTLATLSFTGAGGGDSALGFGLVDLSDAVGFSILDPGLVTSTVTVVPVAVPEPGTLLLFAAAAIVGVGFRRQRSMG